MFGDMLGKPLSRFWLGRIEDLGYVSSRDNYTKSEIKARSGEPDES